MGDLGWLVELTAIAKHAGTKVFPVSLRQEVVPWQSLLVKRPKSSGTIGFEVRIALQSSSGFCRASKGLAL